MRQRAVPRVRDSISGPINKGHPEWTLLECSPVMEEGKVNCPPVMDERAALVGLISTKNTFAAVAELGSEEASQPI